MTRQSTILVVDDEADFRDNVAEHLATKGFNVLQAADGEAALAAAHEHTVDVALLDLAMPGMGGIEVLKRLRKLDSLIEVIMVTGQRSVETAVEAMREGAYHYVTKPVRLKELELTVGRAIEKAGLTHQNRLFQEDQRRKLARTAGGIVAHSESMKQILHEAERMAHTDATVLIEGETGTGKEVVAELIHRESARAERKFAVLNCGALQENLLDAELFGHEKGAFTGATETRPGMIEVADRGTLLLDEIGDIPEAGQIRLLRFLERSVFRKVGSTREQTVDVRVLAATHRELTEEVKEGRFREDLYHRLNVFRLRLPPLRERPSDIFPLAEHFLAQLSDARTPAKTLTEEARGALQAYRWPGNVRELAHAIERAVFAAQIAEADEIRLEHLGLPAPPDPRGLLVPLKEAERRHVTAVLDHFGGNRRQTAEVLGISERHLYRLLQEHGARGG